MKRIGLIAGVGRLPVEFARAARGMGIAVVAVAVVSGVDPELAGAADEFYEIHVGELDVIMTTLKNEGVEQITLLGKVTKELMFSGAAKADRRAQMLLAGLKDYSDDTIMLAFVREFAAEGITVLDQTALLRTLMPAPGVLTDRQPTEQEKADMEFGFRMAKEIGRLDIGQTVVVKNRAVMAVEAIEGTDVCIRRGGLLAGRDAVVVKVAKPKQDLRFDVPGVGPDTIKALIETGGSALAFEAGGTLLVERDKIIALANEHNITIVSLALSE